MKRAGFTLLEVLVATTLMGIAVAGLLSGLSTSMSNASRLTEYDRAALLARRKMDELLVAHRLPKFVVLEGAFDQVNVGWRARVTPFELPPGAGAGAQMLERIELEIWWMNGEKRQNFTLDGYRKGTLLPEDVQSMAR